MKHALILGASGDIGRRCAEMLAAEGWSLYCHYYTNIAATLELTTSLAERYPKQDFFSVALDLRDENALPAFFSALYQIDAIIFAAGKTVYKLLPEVSSQEMEELWQMYLKLPIMICQQLQSKLSQSPFGRIVFISSVYGLAGSAMESIYSGVKGGQISFAKAYAKEVASLGITVNTVAPGAIATEMNAEWSEEDLLALQNEIPMGRLGKAEEVAEIVVALLQPNASYITGTTIPVAGGWLV